MGFRSSWLTFVVLLAACASENNSADLAGPAAMVFLRVTRPAAQDELILARFDLTQRKIAASVFGGFVTLHLDRASDRGFVWHQIEPGTYVVAQFSHQVQWNLCFTKETRVFSILAGQKLYLGDLDPLPLDQELAGQVIRAGDMTLKSNLTATYQVKLPPVLVDPRGSLSAAQLGLQVSSHQAVQTVIPADYQTMPFNPLTRTALLTGAQSEYCGDWLRD